MGKPVIYLAIRCSNRRLCLIRFYRYGRTSDGEIFLLGNNLGVGGIIKSSKSNYVIVSFWGKAGAPSEVSSYSL